MTRHVLFVSILSFILGISSVGLAERSTDRLVHVLPTTDTSVYSLGPAVQGGIVKLYQQTPGFSVKPSSYPLTGFSGDYLQRAYQIHGDSLLSLAYLEDGRIAVFIFDPRRKNEFIVAASTLGGASQTNANQIEAQLRVVFQQAIGAYRKGEFQPLPGATSSSQGQLAEEEKDRRRQEVGVLFRELASLQESNTYLSGNLGMARYGQDADIASTVVFGAYAGLRLSDRIHAELGVNAFHLLLGHVDIRYFIPIAEKYVSFSLSAGIANVLSAIASPSSTLGPVVAPGTSFYGGGLGFDVPLLGALIRGEIKFYTGTSNVVLGSYGIVFNI